jgi:hypothetical protein
MQNFLARFKYFLSNLRHSKLFPLIVTAILVAAVPLTVYVAQQAQDIRQRASQTCREVCDGPPTCRPGDQICDGPQTCRPGDQICDGPPTCRPGDDICDGPPTCRPGEDICDGENGECRPGDDICDGPPTCRPGPDICDGPATNCHAGPDICDGPRECRTGPDICDGPATCRQECTEDAPAQPATQQPAAQQPAAQQPAAQQPAAQQPAQTQTALQKVCNICDCGTWRQSTQVLRTASCPAGTSDSPTKPATCVSHPSCSGAAATTTTTTNSTTGQKVCNICDCGTWRQSTQVLATASCPAGTSDSPTKPASCVSHASCASTTVAASPTPRPGVATPTTHPVLLTPTAPVTGIPLNLTLTFGGIGLTPQAGSPENADPVTRVRPVKVNVTNAAGQVIGTATGNVIYDRASGTYKGTVGLGSIPAGSYIFSVDTPGSPYLDRRIPGIISVPVPAGTTLPEIPELIAGDIDENNAINIIDYNLFSGCYGAKATTSSCTVGIKADLTNDGSTNAPDIDLEDYSVLLHSLTTRQGEL